MRILSFNQNWFADELRELGHDVRTCGHTPGLQVQIPKHTTPIQEVLAGLQGFSPDLLLFLDDSMPTLMISGLDTCDIPSVFYSVDSHHHQEVHPLIATLFDHVLVAQRDYLPAFIRSGVPTTWFPLWAPRFLEPSIHKRFETAFVGTLDPSLNPRRVAFFNALAQKLPIHVSTGAYWDVFPCSEIVVNQTVKGDLNLRVFESMMCGALLITERTGNGLLDLFEDQRHLLTYTADSVEEVVDTIQSLRSDPHRRARIAEAGRAEVLARHTGMHRAVALDGILRGLRRAPRHPRQHYASMINNALVNELLRERQQPPCPYATWSAFRAAQDVSAGGLAPSEREATFLISTCDLYDEITHSDSGSRLIENFQARYPTNPLLSLARISSLVNRGDHTEALRIASALFELPPEQTCALARDVIGRIVRGEIRVAAD